MRKCKNCLCRTCIKSCKCRGCQGKIKECKKYQGFRQLSIFDTPEPKHQKAPRYPWKHYGLENKRYRKKLKMMMQSQEYAHIARHAAYETNKDIAEYILLSINKNLSYEGLERLWQLKEIDRMACGRSDFYGWRREFYGLFNKKMKEMGK